MLKSFIYIKYYPSGIVVEYFMGTTVNIGFSSKLNHKKLSHILIEIENIIDKLKEDGRFNTVKMESHLLVNRKLIKKDVKASTLKKDKISFINLRYIKMLKDKNYDFTQETKKISIFRKYFSFYSMKMCLLIRNIITFNFPSIHEVGFKIPDTNYVGILKISLK
ncbi:hypothetical protein ACOTVM_00775 [Aliarcobacter butzleri]